MDAPEPRPGPVRRALRLVWRVGGFSRRVVLAFVANKGLLIAGALGYNTLLSIVPLFALILVVLSHVIDEQVLISAIATQAEALLPGRGHATNEAFSSFVAHRDVIGWVGTAVLLFFSTIAFRMLDEAMAIVFHRQARKQARHPWRGLILPLSYVALIGLGVLALTLVMIAFDALPTAGVRVLGLSLDAETAVPLVKLLAFIGLVLLLASFYVYMPMTRVRWRWGLVGGFVTALLWEGVRSFMMWYFAKLSLVDVVYGSLGTVVVLLVGLEVAAVIVLLGAEVIAQIERSFEAGKPWYEAPPAEPGWR